MSAHTPGPWELRTYNAQGVVGRQGIFHKGSDLPIVHDVWAKTLAQADANARLIAAAPELAEALRAMIGLAEIATEHMHDQHVDVLAVQAARDALAKAGL